MSKPPAMTSIVTACPPKRSPRKRPRKPEPVKTIITAKPADPPDYEVATERAQQIIQRRLRSPD